MSSETCLYSTFTVLPTVGATSHPQGMKPDVICDGYVLNWKNSPLFYYSFRMCLVLWQLTDIFQDINFMFNVYAVCRVWWDARQTSECDNQHPMEADDDDDDEGIH